MVQRSDPELLNTLRRQAGLSMEGLWIRYFELGGMASVLELEAFLTGALRPPRLERDMVAHAINEALSDKGDSDRAPYLYP